MTEHVEDKEVTADKAQSPDSDDERVGGDEHNDVKSESSAAPAAVMSASVIADTGTETRDLKSFENEETTGDSDKKDVENVEEGEVEGANTDGNEQPPMPWWKKRKIVFPLLAVVLLILIIAIAVGASSGKGNDDPDKQSKNIDIPLTSHPSGMPSIEPSASLSFQPSASPSNPPSALPSIVPTNMPTARPTPLPTLPPTTKPTATTTIATLQTYPPSFSVNSTLDNSTSAENSTLTTSAPVQSPTTMQPTLTPTTPRPTTPAPTFACGDFTRKKTCLKYKFARCSWNKKAKLCSFVGTRQLRGFST